MKKYILAFDQGTTSSRAVLFDEESREIGLAQQELPQIYPAPGFVEHDPAKIWQSQIKVAKQVLKENQLTAENIVAIGITNQRETTILWERETGKLVANAIVWQSRVSAYICDQLKTDGVEGILQEKTGLVLDAYFSASKIKHLLDTTDGLRARAERGEILFGTVDTYLIWKLTNGRAHKTDISNASRTLLFNIHTLEWDDELLKIFNIPRSMLPEVCASSEIFGMTDPSWFGKEIPIAGCAGDQQAATFGQTCFEKGMVKNTYGTGCFLLLNTGNSPVVSKNHILTTIGWKIGNEVTYCLEGSVFVGGAVVQWLRDGLHAIETSEEVESLAAKVPHSNGIVFVPAFVGLGAPYWDANARGAIFGITRDTTIEHVALAALEAIAFQTRELLEAMQKDADMPIPSIRADGGAASNNALMQFQADMLNLPVQRPVCYETTALGAAYFAGLQVGYWENQQVLVNKWKLDQEFLPQLEETERAKRYHLWLKAVQRTLDWKEGS